MASGKQSWIKKRLVNKYKQAETSGKRVKMGTKSSQTVTRSKQVAIDKKRMNVRKWADKNTKHCAESDN